MYHAIVNDIRDRTLRMSKSSVYAFAKYAMRRSSMSFTIKHIAKYACFLYAFGISADRCSRRCHCERLILSIYGMKLSQQDIVTEPYSIKEVVT